MARAEKNKSVSVELLDSYRRALMAVKDFFDDAATQMSSMDDIELKLKLSLGINTLGEKLGKNIESLDRLEEKVDKDEALNTKRKGGSETSLFEEM